MMVRLGGLLLLLLLLAQPSRQTLSRSDKKKYKKNKTSKEKIITVEEADPGPVNRSSVPSLHCTE